MNKIGILGSEMVGKVLAVASLNHLGCFGAFPASFKIHGRMLLNY